MISQPECRAIFHYAFRPLVREYKRYDLDGGFSVTVYDDNRAVFVMYDLPYTERTRATFMLDESFVKGYLAILSENDHWLQKLDQNVRLPENRVARYCSTFGFNGYSLINCDDPVEMMRMRLGTPEGYAARRLCMLFEDIMMLLNDYGLNLQFNDWFSANRPLEYRDHTAEWMAQSPNAMGM